MTKNERFQLVVPSDVLDMVRRLADQERRSISNMIVVLLVEALRSRESKQETKPGNWFQRYQRPALLAQYA